jgi:hypothetical protein
MAKRNNHSGTAVLDAEAAVAAAQPLGPRSVPLRLVLVQILHKHCAKNIASRAEETG